MMIDPPHMLVDMLKPWADFYSDSSVAPTIVTFLHLGGLLFAGGTAVAADRVALRLASNEGGQRDTHLAERHQLHRVVIGGLIVVVISGILMLTADIETFYASAVYWTKMALVAALLGNGFWMTRIERTLARVGTSDARAWKRFRGATLTSIALWFTITFFGVTLVNAS
jgi:uncharacterized membrane protein